VGFAYGVGFGRYELFPFEQAQALRHALENWGDPTPKAEPRHYGRWREARKAAGAGAIDNDTLDQLSTLGYLGGYERAKTEGGITVFDTENVQGGLTLFASGHAPVVFLMSLTGEIVHEWQIKFEDIWPDGLPFETERELRQFIRRAYVFPNGDLLAVFEYIGIFKLDKDSNLIWKSAGQNHHDFSVAADGTIVTLVRMPLTVDEVHAKYPGFKPTSKGTQDDQIVFLNPAGVELKRISLLEAFYQSDYAMLLAMRSGVKDVFHTNSVTWVTKEPNGSPLDGQLLISLRDLDTIALVDIERERISWTLAGPWRRQHQAQPLENGNILLLDNQGGNRETPLVADQSEVIEINPTSHEIVWRYVGSDEHPFYTVWLGYVQRLANGNTLVTESAQGRIFEVTQQGRIVWEYLSPYRIGDENELIATIMGARRFERKELVFLESIESEPADTPGEAL
jgi:hypothetical protein